MFIPLFTWFFYMPGGAGFLPSTVSCQLRHIYDKWYPRWWGLGKCRLFSILLHQSRKSVSWRAFYWGDGSYHLWEPYPTKVVEWWVDVNHQKKWHCNIDRYPLSCTFVLHLLQGSTLGLAWIHLRVQWDVYEAQIFCRAHTHTPYIVSHLMQLMFYYVHASHIYIHMYIELCHGRLDSKIAMLEHPFVRKHEVRLGLEPAISPQFVAHFVQDGGRNKDALG